MLAGSLAKVKDELARRADADLRAVHTITHFNDTIYMPPTIFDTSCQTPHIGRGGHTVRCPLLQSGNQGRPNSVLGCNKFPCPAPAALARYLGLTAAHEQFAVAKATYWGQTPLLQYLTHHPTDTLRSTLVPPAGCDHCTNAPPHTPTPATAVILPRPHQPKPILSPFGLLLLRLPISPPLKPPALRA